MALAVVGVGGWFKEKYTGRGRLACVEGFEKE